MGETQATASISHITRAFSILKRIVMGETVVVRYAHLAETNFQYPQADRDG